MTIRNVVLTGTVCLVWTGLCGAENRVVVESKAVPPGAEDVTLGVFIANDTDIAGIVIPLEFREIDPGAYISDTISVTIQGRLTSWDDPDSSYSVKLFFPSRTPPSYSPPNACSPDSSGNVWQYSYDTLDFVSPDAFLYGVVGLEKAALAAGDDGLPGSGTPSILLTFDVTNDTGRFEIDASCTWPLNILEYVVGKDPLNSIAFTKGVVTIVDSCACDCHADPVCDSVHNVLDLVAIVGVAFQGADPIPDPNPFCPYETTDVNCDDVTNVLDVGLMNQVVNYGANPDSTFCDPCAP